MLLSTQKVCLSLIHSSSCSILSKLCTFWIDFISCFLSEKFTEVLNKQRQERAEHDRERIRLLTADPFDPEAQRLIAEEIRQEITISVY